MSREGCSDARGCVEYEQDKDAELVPTAAQYKISCMHLVHTSTCSSSQKLEKLLRKNWHRTDIFDAMTPT